jgi:hypothetical protein
VFVKEANDSSAVFFNPVGLPVDCRLYVARLSFEQLIYLNSAIACLLFEIFNRAGLGEGARSLMVSDYNKVPCLFTEGESSAFGKTLNSICHKQPRKLLDPFDPEWHALDEVVFDVLGLTAGEREAVYEAVVNLVRAAGEDTERVIDYKAMAEFAHANGEECVSDPDDRNLLTEPSAHTVDAREMGAYPETAS